MLKQNEILQRKINETPLGQIKGEKWIEKNS